MEKINEDLWSPSADRPRQWQVMIMGDTVTARYYAILEPGEDLTEYPRTERMTRAEWAEVHGTYGLDIDGQPLPETE